MKYIQSRSYHAPHREHLSFPGFTDLNKSILTNFVVRQLLILKIWICSVYIVVAVWQSGSKFNLYSATLLIRTLFRIRIWILSKLGANFWIRSRSKYRTSIMYVNPQHWSEISCFQRNILPGKVLSPTCWPVLVFLLDIPNEMNAKTNFGPVPCFCQHGLQLSAELIVEFLTIFNHWLFTITIFIMCTPWRRWYCLGRPRGTGRIYCLRSWSNNF